jgi:AcrR family transcriptional regulator
MSLRDKQDFESRRQQIIDGALQVFASKGFEKATNKEIAAAAGIGSPGLIYHYFKDKSDLFRQVVEQRLPLLQLLTHGEEIVTKAPQDVLTLFGHAFLKVTDNPTSVALIKLLLGEAFRQPQLANLFNTIGPSRSFAFLTCYLEQQMAAGVLKSMHPGVAARCFIGSLLAYIFTREIFLQPDTQQISSEMMVATAVEVFLQGMQISLPDDNSQAV